MEKPKKTSSLFQKINNNGVVVLLVMVMFSLLLKLAKTFDKEVNVKTNEESIINTPTVTPQPTSISKPTPILVPTINEVLSERAGDVAFGAIMFSLGGEQSKYMEDYGGPNKDMNVAWRNLRDYLYDYPPELFRLENLYNSKFGKVTVIGDKQCQDKKYEYLSCMSEYNIKFTKYSNCMLTIGAFCVKPSLNCLEPECY